MMNEETIFKSTRHQKIIGQFGEQLVCNWLSRSGLEVAMIDHTGIDVIAALPSGKRIGISVKSRTRVTENEADSVNLLKGNGKAREKLEAACKAFGLEPWLAVYVECGTRADLYLTSLKNYDRNYRTSTASDYWNMTEGAKQTYERDANVMHISFSLTVGKWWRRELAAEGKLADHRR